MEEISGVMLKLAATIAGTLVVYFALKRLRPRFSVPREFNRPSAVTMAVLFFFGIYGFLTCLGQVLSLLSWPASDWFQNSPLYTSVCIAIIMFLQTKERQT